MILFQARRQGHTQTIESHVNPGLFTLKCLAKPRRKSQPDVWPVVLGSPISASTGCLRKVPLGIDRQHKNFERHLE